MNTITMQYSSPSENWIDQNNLVYEYIVLKD